MRVRFPLATPFSHPKTMIYGCCFYCVTIFTCQNMSQYLNQSSVSFRTEKNTTCTFSESDGRMVRNQKPTFHNQDFQCTIQKLSNAWAFSVLRRRCRSSENMHLTTPWKHLTGGIFFRENHEDLKKTPPVSRCDSTNHSCRRSRSRLLSSREW